jgi:pyridoxal phosphate enzyme (YggS family)
MLRNNLQNIRQRIIEAAGRANRSPEEIKLVAVSKRFSKEKISEAIGCGQFVFGENYIQESIEKIPFLGNKYSDCSLSWHFIGKLQSNKARKAAELFDVIETIDSIKLARTLEKHLAVLDKTLTGYIQINIGREEQKSGILPEKCESLLQQLAELKHLQIKGLMAMPPYFTDPEKSRLFFKEMRDLAENLISSKLIGLNGPVELSMGMSGDFEVAIEEGATVVRLGTALFGSRQTEQN